MHLHSIETTLSMIVKHDDKCFKHLSWTLLSEYTSALANSFWTLFFTSASDIFFFAIKLFFIYASFKYLNNE